MCNICLNYSTVRSLRLAKKKQQDESCFFDQLQLATMLRNDLHRLFETMGPALMLSPQVQHVQKSQHCWYSLCHNSTQWVVCGGFFMTNHNIFFTALSENLVAATLIDIDIVRQNLYGFKSVKDLAILRFNRKKQYGNNVVGVKLLNIPTGGPGPTAYLSVSRLTLTFNICRHPRSSPQDVWCAPISPDGKPTGIFRQIPRPIRKCDLKSDCVFAWIF